MILANVAMMKAIVKKMNLQENTQKSKLQLKLHTKDIFFDLLMILKVQEKIQKN